MDRIPSPLDPSFGFSRVSEDDSNVELLTGALELGEMLPLASTKPARAIDVEGLWNAFDFVTVQPVLTT